MKDALKPYAHIARVLLVILGSALAIFGFVSAATAQVIVGAALAFGIVFWQIYAAVSGKEAKFPYALLTTATAAISTILVGLGIDQGHLAALVGGGAGIFLTMYTTFITKPAA